MDIKDYSLCAYTPRYENHEDATEAFEALKVRFQDVGLLNVGSEISTDDHMSIWGGRYGKNWYLLIHHVMRRCVGIIGFMPASSKTVLRALFKDKSVPDLPITIGKNKTYAAEIHAKDLQARKVFRSAFQGQMEQDTFGMLGYVHGKRGFGRFEFDVYHHMIHRLSRFPFPYIIISPTQMVGSAPKLYVVAIHENPNITEHANIVLQRIVGQLNQTPTVSQIEIISEFHNINI